MKSQDMSGFVSCDKHLPTLCVVLDESQRIAAKAFYGWRIYALNICHVLVAIRSMRTKVVVDHKCLSILAQILPNVSRSGIKPLSTRDNVAGLTPISLATSRIDL